MLGEGAAMLVLEDWVHAMQRDARIRGELIGYGLSTDAGYITRPTIGGQAWSMALALQSAQLGPERIGDINAHGTATAANDAVESGAIKQVFGERAYRIPVSSTKSMQGHLLGAAGAIELVATLLALEAATLPPAINLRVANAQCDLDYVTEGARSVGRLEIAMSNAFAFRGTNAVLVCRTARDDSGGTSSDSKG